MTKWSTKTIDGRCRGSIDGAIAHQLFEEEDIHKAARCGDLRELERLIDETKDVDVLDKAGRTALHFAAGFGRVACTRLLLKRGARLEVRDVWSKAPVDFALQAKQFETVKLMRIEAIERNLDIGARGTVSPLRTMHEYCYDLTTEEVEELMQKHREEAMADYERMNEEEKKSLVGGRDPREPILF